ncbi:MAG: hypothetical protein ACE5I9_12635 [Candidatus Methylomirabilales bacterium]
MGKRLLTLFITVSLLLGVSGMAAAFQHDIEKRSSYGHPLRIVGFILFPVGLLLDTVFFRPLTHVACSAPDLTGCTPEEQRAVGIVEEVDQELDFDPIGE